MRHERKNCKMNSFQITNFEKLEKNDDFLVKNYIFTRLLLYNWFYQTTLNRKVAGNSILHLYETSVNLKVF